jgi:hypothetical protein
VDAVEFIEFLKASLDGGGNVTAPSNGTLIEIPDESRFLTLYANDTEGNWTTPQTVYYDITFNLGAVPEEPFPWLRGGCRRVCRCRGGLPEETQNFWRGLSQQSLTGLDFGQETLTKLLYSQKRIRDRGLT